MSRAIVNIVAAIGVLLLLGGAAYVIVDALLQVLRGLA